MVPPGLIVRNARVHPTTLHGAELRDVQVDGDAIAAIGPAGSIAADGRPELDADGRLLSPPLVDPHVHLDAVLTVGEPRHNESGTLIEGIQTWAERKPFLTHEDVKDRAREAIRWEVAQGTGLIRSHVDVCDPEPGRPARRCSSCATRSATSSTSGSSPSPRTASCRSRTARSSCARRCASAATSSAASRTTSGPATTASRRSTSCSTWRSETGAPIDLHCDETDDEQSRFLEVVAARTMRDGHGGPGGRRAHDGDGLVQRRLRLQAPPDPQAGRRHDRGQPARQHRPPGPLRHVPEAARHDPGQGARRGRDQRRLRPRLDHGPVVPARPGLDARRAVDARPRRPDDRPDRAVPGLRDGHDQPGPGGRGRVRGEGGDAGQLRRLRLRR